MTHERLQQALRLHQSGDLTSASSLYEQIVADEPGHAEALHLLGVATLQGSDPLKAVELIERAVAIRSDQAAWFGNLGTARSAVGDLDGAIDAYESALHIDPAHAESHYNVAHVYRQQCDLSAAEAAYLRALEIAPKHVGALNNLGTTLREAGRSDEAVEVFRRAVRVQPTFAEALYNLGNVLRDVDCIEESIGVCQQSLALVPESAEVKASLGMSYLTRGDFEVGLPLYEFRHAAKGGGISSDCEPRWDGSALEGRKIMLFAEQGLGDTLQFVRYAGLLSEQASEVYIECQAPLVSILSTYQPLSQVVPRGQALPDFDVAAPLLSLPYLCGTNLDAIPAPTPYLHAENWLVERWAEELGSQPGFRVGIAWQGAPGHLSDVRRSVPLAEFQQLAAVKGVSLIALQKGFGVQQIDDVSFPVHRLADDVDESHGAFMDTAAIMMNLDLVVTSDTSIAHLAGALGVPVWIALATGADWRWMSNRDDSPWYPTARLFRQSEPGNWDGVFVQMAETLATLVLQSPGQSTMTASAQGTNDIRVEVSAGELLDKITILQIKRSQIQDAQKLQNINRELASLEQTRAELIPDSQALDQLIAELRATNETLWEIEDDIRECERQREFGDEFVQLARRVYITNDKRSELKREINELLGSRLVEEKSYSHYE